MIERALKFTLGSMVFVLPLHTIFIIHEKFSRGVKLEYETIGLYATEGLIWISTALFLIWFISKWKKEIKIKPFVFSFTRERIFALSVFIFILYGFLSSFWAINQQIAVQHARWILEAFLLFFMLFIGPLNIRDILFITSSAGVAQSAFAIWQFLSQTTFASSILGLSAHNAWEAGTSIIETSQGAGERWARAYGTFPHPNMLGGYLALSIIALDIIKKFYKNKNAQIFILIAQITQITALFFTFSRSAWIAIIIWFFVSAISKTKSISKPCMPFGKAGIIIIFFLIIAFFPLIKTRLTNSTIPENRSINERQNEYSEALKIWKNNPLFGAGTGNYTLSLAIKFPDKKPWSFQPSHFTPLLFLSELGIIGALLLLTVLISFFSYQKISAYSLAVFLPVFPLILFDHYLYSSYTGLLILALFHILSTKRPQ